MASEARSCLDWVLRRPAASSSLAESPVARRGSDADVYLALVRKQRESSLSAMSPCNNSQTFIVMVTTLAPAAGLIFASGALFMRTSDPMLSLWLLIAGLVCIFFFLLYLCILKMRLFKALPLPSSS